MSGLTEADMRALLEGGEVALQQLWLEVMNWLRDHNQLEDVARMIANGQYDDAIKSIDSAAKVLAEEWVRQFSLAGVATAVAARDATGRMISFDGTNPQARAALDLARMELTSGLTRDVRELVQAVISRGLATGENPLVMARTIVDSLGLTPEMEAIVYNYRLQLEAGQFGAAARRRLADGRYAGRQDATDEQIDAMVSNYRDAWRLYRAELVARTESLAALHEGVENALQQAYASGELDPSEIGATWRCAMRPLSRDSHVTTNGQEREVDGYFTLGSGTRVRYPGDSNAPARERCNCQCVVEYRMTPNV